MEDTVEQKKPQGEETAAREAVLEPIGDVVIGSIDPRTLSKEEFENSPELLFHGSSQDFVFQRDFDYQNFRNPGSQTIGEGFYATNDPKAAEIYSQVRQGQPLVKPKVIKMLPYRARMLDLRSKSNPRINAPIPPNLLNSYLDYYRGIFETKWKDYVLDEDINFLNTHPPGDETVGEERTRRSNRWWYFRHMREYLQTLDRLGKEPEQVDLRVMLSMTGDPHHSEFGGHFFREFMLQRGYDGVNYIEGGESAEHRNPTSYVFFNLQKIGTYETWHQPDKSQVLK